MTSRYAACGAAVLGIGLVGAGLLGPAAPAYVIGVLLLAGGLGVLAWRTGRRWPVAVLAGLAVVALVWPWIALPRSTGVTPDWRAEAVGGEVLAGRAVVSVSPGEPVRVIDLVTGKTITLGSVGGGTPIVADGRLYVVGDARVDAVALDASRRWTWTPPVGARVTAVGADGGVLALRVCRGGACEFVGVGAEGRQAWTAPARGISADSPVVAAQGSLPRVVVPRSTKQDTTAFLLDPATGRRQLQRVDAVEALPDGRVAIAWESGGRCVTRVYEGLDDAESHVTEGPCPESVAVPVPEVPETEVMVAIDAGLNPFRGSDERSVVTVEGRPGVRLLVPHGQAEVLRVDGESIVVEGGDEVIRYTFP